MTFQLDKQATAWTDGLPPDGLPPRRIVQRLGVASGGKEVWIGKTLTTHESQNKNGGTLFAARRLTAAAHGALHVKRDWFIRRTELATPLMADKLNNRKSRNRFWN